MASRTKKNKKKNTRASQNNDRISSLPDELIHKILSFLDAKVALQTSILAKRWKFIWTTLPFLNISEYACSLSHSTYMFISHILCNRNHQTHISELNLHASYKYSESLFDKFVEYAISHNVEYLNLELLLLALRNNPYKLSNLSSKSLKKVTLRVTYGEFARELDCWDLPALTFLRLVGSTSRQDFNFRESCLACLPALRTLCLDNWDFSESSFSFSLPHLTALCLSGCHGFPQTAWNFPALLSLELDGIILPKDMGDILSKLVNLQNLTLISFAAVHSDHVLSCPQLLNLNIRLYSGETILTTIKFLTPKLCNFSFSGVFFIWLEAPKLESVNIKLRGWFGNMDWVYRKRYYQLFTKLLSRLGNANMLTFDSESIQALSAAKFLASLPSPFYNLKTVKLSHGCKESSISSGVRRYLLDGSPGATIVTTMPHNQVNHQVGANSSSSKKVMLNRSSTTATNVNSVVNAERMSQVGAQVSGTSNDRARSSRGIRDFGLWHGHEVNSEFVGLLDLIMKHYPDTFKHFTAKSEKFYTMKVNMLCTLVNEFLRTSMSDFNTDIIAEYRDLFADMQRWGFSVNWLVSHLNYIEQLLFSPHELHATDSCMDDAKNKLQELQTLCSEKIT